MDWRWFTTPAEPRGRYGILTGVITLVAMAATKPLWQGQAVPTLMLVGGLAGFFGGVVAKLIMERRR